VTIATEFGTEFPPEIQGLLMEGAQDQSWHNDICPSVGLWSDRCDLRLWCHHAVEWEPEIGSRYAVAVYLHDSDTPTITYPTVIHDGYETDDVNEAIRVFTTTAHDLHTAGLLNRSSR
jgi:hypothetical protein